MLSENINTSSVVSNVCCHGNDCTFVVVFGSEATNVQNARKGEGARMCRREQEMDQFLIIEFEETFMWEFFTTSE